MVNLIKGNQQKLEKALSSLMEPALQFYGKEREQIIGKALDTTYFYGMEDETVSTAINNILQLKGCNKIEIPYDKNILSYFFVNPNTDHLDKYVLFQNATSIDCMKDQLAHEFFGHVLYGMKAVQVVTEGDGIYCIRNGFTLKSPTIPYEYGLMWTEGCACHTQQQIMLNAGTLFADIPMCYQVAYEGAVLLEKAVGRKALQNYLIDYEGTVPNRFDAEMETILPCAFDYIENIAQLHYTATMEGSRSLNYYRKEIKDLTLQYSKKKTFHTY